MKHHSKLIQVIQKLSFCRDLNAVVDVLRDASRELTHSDGIAVVLRDGDQCYYAEENAIGPLWKGRRFPMESCISGWVMLQKQAVAIPDIYQDPRIPHDAYQPTFVKSLAMVPIRTEDPIGAIGAYWATYHEATPEELEILQALGDTASIALANALLIASLEEANQRKDQFLAMLAHELRNPLAPIRNALHVLQLYGTTDPRIERARELMERQASHLSRIVDSLLDVSRFNRGKIELNRQRLDLARLVRQTFEDCQSQMGDADLRPTLRAPETPVWVLGDATRLVQVFSNILGNACKFTPSGGQIVVSLEAEDNSSEAVVRVQDTGLGIEAKNLEYIFEAFAQADRSLERGRGGLGLGLSIAREILQLHGASISASSGGLGRGSVFTVRIPRQAELPALDEKPLSAKPAGQGFRVLIVEDNQDSAESLRILLEVCGYDVTLAHSGPEGVQAAVNARPDVVLCDIGLPGMDGFAVADTLRNTPETASTRLIAVTGYGQEEDQRRARAAGFDLHLVKPVDPDSLLDHLAQTQSPQTFGTAPA